MPKEFHRGRARAGGADQGQDWLLARKALVDGDHGRQTPERRRDRGRWVPAGEEVIQEMGILAVCPKPRALNPAKGHKKFQCLLRGMCIWLPNQVLGYIHNHHPDLAWAHVSRGNNRLAQQMPDRLGTQRRT